LDLIDLRLLGITAMSQLSIDANVVTVKSPSTGDTIAEITLLGFTGTLSASDFFLAEAVDGAGQAARGGAGLSGGDAADSLRGSTDQDFLLGNGAADLAWGRAGNDVLDGGAASDVLHGGQGADRLLGGEGDDAARGGQGADRLLGDAGSDSLRGGAGDDVLLGGDGQDSLIGGEGNDTLDAGPGADLLRGGAGADSFLLRFGALDGDRIVDFSRDEGDQLHLLAEAAVTVQALGQGRFTVSDGTLTETLIVHGALASDFLL
jgi:Ca2+-binding RTX toxin-like protein